MTPRKAPPCRFCGESRQTEWTDDQQFVFCNTCGKAFPVTPPKPVPAPVRRGSL